MRMKSLLAATAILSTLLVLELVLQIGAVTVWLLYRSDPVDARQGQQVILCVGDSYTYGVGSSSPSQSYPAQLEARLRNQGLSNWKVVNGGWPGRNSRELLENLGGQLQTAAPSFVYILVGLNDEWSRPEPLSVGEIDPSAGRTFQWRFRTGRLVAILTRRYSGAGPAPAEMIATKTEGVGASTAPIQQSLPPPELVGTWFGGGWVSRIDADGSVVGTDGTMRSVVEGNQMVFLDAKGREASRIQWQRDGNELHLTGVQFLTPLVLHAGSDLEQTTWKMRQAGDLRGAVTMLERMKAAHRNPADVARAAQPLLIAAEAAGQDALSLRASRLLTDDEQGIGFPWLALASQRLRAGDTATATRAIERAIALSRSSGEETAYQRYRAAILVRTNSKEALKSTLAAFLLDGREDLLARQLLPRKREGSDVALRILRECFEELDVPADQRSRIEALYGRVGKGKEYLTALELHLREIAALTLASGARPVFLSYPFALPEIEETVKRVAGESHADWLDIRAEFDRLLQTRRREELFVPDGHLNDRGYEIMAGFVAMSLPEGGSPGLDRR
jgi:hypothetical protein